MIRVEVIVVNHGTAPLTLALVESIEGWARLRGATIHVLDSGSPGDPGRELAGLEGRARLTLLTQNRGFGAAANHGARASEADWLLFANPDVTLSPQTLDRLAEAAARGRAVLGGVSTGGPRAHGPTGEEGPDGCIETEWVAGSLMLVPRRDFVEAGGFDEGYFMYLEDVDLCRRLARAGLPIRVVRGAAYQHPGGASYGATGRDRKADWRASRRRYLSRHHGPAAAWLYALYARADDFLRRLRRG